MTVSFVTGFAAAFSLILAIGAQNAFVLRQGLKGEHVLPLVLFCAISDAILVTSGVLGFGAIVKAWPGFPQIMAFAGAAFLFVYGLLRFRAAYLGGTVLKLENGAQSLWATLGIAATLTWANPHVYVDTVGLLGAISTSHHGVEKLAFSIGAILASFVFFFALGFGAKSLSPYMQSTTAWRVLDTGIGVIMWWLATALFYSGLTGAGLYPH